MSITSSFINAGAWPHPATSTALTLPAAAARPRRSVSRTVLARSKSDCWSRKNQYRTSYPVPDVPQVDVEHQRPREVFGNRWIVVQVVAAIPFRLCAVQGEMTPLRIGKDAEMAMDRAQVAFGST